MLSILRLSDTCLENNIRKKHLVACIVVVIDHRFEWSLYNSVLHISTEMLLYGNYSQERHSEVLRWWTDKSHDPLSKSECLGGFSSIAVGKTNIAWHFICDGYHCLVQLRSSRLYKTLCEIPYSSYSLCHFKSEPLLVFPIMVSSTPTVVPSSVKLVLTSFHLRKKKAWSFGGNWVSFITLHSRRVSFPTACPCTKERC